MKATAIVLALCFFMITLSAQSPALPQAGVHTVSGTASVLRNGKQVFLKQGDYIFSNDRITVKTATSLTLVTTELRFIEIKKPGSYLYAELVKGLSDKSIGISKKFLDLLWQDFIKPENKKSALTPKSIGGATGGASRGCDLLVEPLPGTKSANDTLFFSWRSSHAKSYQFTLQDNNQNELLNIITKDTSLVILKRGLLRDESDTYSWMVVPDNNKLRSCAGSSNSFTVTSIKERQRQITDIISQVEMSTDLFSYNLKVSEELGMHGWYGEAYEYFLKAKASVKGK